MSPIRDAIMAEARAREGAPYGLPPGPGQFDCSLFVLKVLEAAGIPLAGVRTAEQIRQACVPIDMEDVKAGDLLFFEHTYDTPGASHVGFSLGRGTGQMWNANEAHGVSITNIRTDYWSPKLLDFRRPPGLAADVAAPTYPRGIDVSNNNGHIDWAAVAASGAQFALAKATEGTGFRDAFFPDNFIEMRKHGIIRGAYHFARPDRSSAEDEAAYFLRYVNSVGLKRGDLLALDLESYNGSLERASASGIGVAEWALSWLRYAEREVGFRPLVYTAGNVVRLFELARYPELGDYGLWLASWGVPTPPQAPPPWGLVAIHQYDVGAAGTVSGVAGEIDLDRYNGPIETLSLYGKPAETAPPVDDRDAKITALTAALVDRDARLSRIRRALED